MPRTRPGFGGFVMSQAAAPVANGADTAQGPRRVHGAGYHVDFAVGQRCLVQFERDGQKYRSVIVGFEQYCFVIARLPMAPGIQNRMRAGNSVIVRLEQDGTVYGFTTQILTVALKPAPIMVFAYPGSVEGLQYRHHKRTQCMLPTLVVNDFLQADGLVTDVSVGGCRVVIDWRDKNRVFNLMSGDGLELQLHLGGQGPQAVDARIMNVKELKRHYTLGLKFEGEHKHKPVAHFIARLEGAWAAIEDGATRGF